MMMMMGSSTGRMMAGCTAYDLILVHRTSSVTDTTTSHTNEAPPSTTTSLEATQQLLPSIGASECMFRFGTQYSSSTSSSSTSDHQVSQQQQQQQHKSRVYLVVHHSQTGDTLRFPISAHNIMVNLYSKENMIQWRYKH
jgi:uncharacterized membrane protein YfhO